ncbi:JmjC domain-containing protein [Gynuella sp.]|uniref:JmjC domain-containing protein n=1 Tax=Gynuella sp. TaxID=2969146 RepID=UPI003D10516A
MQQTLNFDIDDFLKNYWQCKPLLIRQAIDPDLLQISQEELFDFAAQEWVESRIVSSQDQQDWTLHRGPFEPDDYERLATKDWTLLVQAVDQFIPEANQLKKMFDFVPSWRLDDIMVSLAKTGAGVGPHFDQYDVFLIQGCGQRRWQIGPVGDSNSALLENCELSILKNMQVDHQWDLSPGDILYLPPGITHNGTALTDDCMTISVGFRAPAHSEILDDYFGRLSARIDQSLRYTDPAIQMQKNPHAVTVDAVSKLKTIVGQYANNETLLSQWLGEFMTEPKYPEHFPEQPTPSWEVMQDIINTATCFQLHPGARAAVDDKYLFINGESWARQELNSELIDFVLNHTIAEASQFNKWLENDAGRQLAIDLISRNCLLYEESQ